MTIEEAIKLMLEKIENLTGFYFRGMSDERYLGGINGREVTGLRVIEAINLRALIEAGMAMREEVDGLTQSGERSEGMQAWDRALKEATDG